MPGGRLTERDRQQIASGLAEGLGYAAISRQLGRPTSTISREVARNGGRDGYRDDQAHHDTGQRTRRRKPPLPPERPAAADGRDPEAVRGFVEHFATLMAETGLSRMAARVFTCLFTTDSGTLTAAELVRYLRVSPASVSKAIGYLEELELVRRERAPMGRREQYIVDDDVWLRAWKASARKNASWSDAARQGSEILGTATPAGVRVRDMSQFFAQLSEDMAGGNSMSDGPAAAIITDALIVLAALAHARAPLTVAHLAAALGWPPDRVTSALRGAEAHPDITDPVTLHRAGPGTYAIAARPNRLTATQRQALSQLSGSG
jgi:DNA-binding transcriptional regulator GbsR (MarR family)